VFQGMNTRRGLNLTSFDGVRMTIDYHGPGNTLRLFLKNDDPPYNKPGDRTTAKVNSAEFSVVDGRQTIVLHPEEFSVAGWWLIGKTISPQLERTQYDRILAADISSGTTAPAGVYRIKVESLVLSRSRVAPDQLYLMIIAGWAVVLGVYIFLRVRKARNDQMEKERVEAEAREALAAAKEAAERANQAKSEFLANMSHELRTPLNGVLGFVQILERSNLTDKQMTAVRAIHRSGDHLLSLIVDILDLSKIEAGKIEFNSAPMNLRHTLDSVAEMLQARAEAKGVAFSVEVDPDAPHLIIADDMRLRQVLLNLLSNAVKFTDQGQVSLRVIQRGHSLDTATLFFEVRDSGPGIAEDALERIFQPFEQVGDQQKRSGGTGLGLAISQELVGLMGASIKVESRLGEGARFWFEATFPVCAPVASYASVEA